ncbi:MAG: sugar phosphate isomerase/epimerase [Actinobacteria bacterium]|nr:sugar phosphate isomerase/epimerase [Actinomycetota bacterium]
MMKLCCLTLSYRRTFEAGAMDLTGFLDECRRLGLDGVDLHEAAFAQEDRAYLAMVKRACLDRGLAIACVSISNNFGQAGAALDADLAKTQRWIDHAAYLGAPQVRVFAGRTPEGDAEAAAWQRCETSLRRTAAYGADTGVVVSVQNHNHKMLTRTGADLLRLVQGVAHANLGHVLDTGQYAGSPGASGSTEENRGAFDYLASIRQTAPLATHVRCKLYRLETGREAWLDYDRIFSILRDVRYNGWIALVYEGVEEDRAAIAKGAPFLREYVARYST